jgi:hypothetical protein
MRDVHCRTFGQPTICSTPSTSGSCEWMATPILAAEGCSQAHRGAREVVQCRTPNMPLTPCPAVNRRHRGSIPARGRNPRPFAPAGLKARHCKRRPAVSARTSVRNSNLHRLIISTKRSILNSILNSDDITQMETNIRNIRVMSWHFTFADRQQADYDRQHITMKRLASGFIWRTRRRMVASAKEGDASWSPLDASDAWKAIQNTTNLVVLGDFIQRFGTTPIYGALARTRREKLARKSAKDTFQTRAWATGGRWWRPADASRALTPAEIRATFFQWRRVRLDHPVRRQVQNDLHCRWQARQSTSPWLLSTKTNGPS